MGKKVKIIPYKKSFASHNLKNATWSTKNILKPTEVLKSSNKKYYFDCTICGHEYDRSLNQALKNGSCSYCAHKCLCSDLECQMCFENSFASHPKAKLWSPLNTGNPRDYFSNSNDKFLFNCDICMHTYDMALYHVSSGKKCGYCYGDRLCDNDDCIICKEKSFASHQYANYWSDKNSKTARQVHKKSKTSALFECNKCNHTFERLIFNIIHDTFCLYCIHQCLCDDNNCDFCYNNSFASVEKSKYWSDLNTFKPRNYFKSSGIKFLFTCPDCNEYYEAPLCNVTSGAWCSCTKNKTETILSKYLQSSTKDVIENQRKFNWCKNIRQLPFDFCIEDLKLIIELDGRQHFQQIQNWSSPEIQEKNDRYKMKMANENGYSIIRICQETVWNDKNNWKEKLKSFIKKYKEVTNIFIGNIYETAKIITNHTYKTILITNKTTVNAASKPKPKI